MKTPQTDKIFAIVDTHERQEALVSLCRQLEEELNQSKLQAAQYRSFLYGCDKHKLWAGLSCIGCLEDERNKLKEDYNELKEKFENWIQLRL